MFSLLLVCKWIYSLLVSFNLQSINFWEVDKDDILCHYINNENSLKFWTNQKVHVSFDFVKFYIFIFSNDFLKLLSETLYTVCEIIVNCENCASQNILKDLRRIKDITRNVVTNSTSFSSLLLPKWILIVFSELIFHNLSLKEFHLRAPMQENETISELLYFLNF